MERQFGGSTTVYVYSGTLPIAEYAAGAQLSQPNREYIYAGAQMLATVDASLGTSYQYHDHLSTRVEADVNGNVTRTFGHFPFGEVWYETGTPSKWKFTSYERAETGESDLDYAQFRYASSRPGRFMSRDRLAGSTADPQSLDRYTYTRNDSVDLTDPSGLTVMVGCLLDDMGNCVAGRTFTFNFNLGGGINDCTGRGFLDYFCAATPGGTQAFQDFISRHDDPVRAGLNPIAGSYNEYAKNMGPCDPNACPIFFKPTGEVDVGFKNGIPQITIYVEAIIVPSLGPILSVGSISVPGKK